jgi:hypothetical protein
VPLLIDHQPVVALVVTSIDRTVMINNVAALAQTARDLGVPVVLSAGSRLIGVQRRRDSRGLMCAEMTQTDWRGFR